MYDSKHVDFSPDTRKKIANAVNDILNGVCSKVHINKNATVYECKNVIRIDLKIVEEE